MPTRRGRADLQTITSRKIRGLIQTQRKRTSAPTPQSVGGGIAPSLTQYIWAGHLLESGGAQDGSHHTQAPPGKPIPSLLEDPNRAGVCAQNADISGHAEERRWTRKANPNIVPSASYKDVDGRHSTSDEKHQRNHRYDPAGLAAEGKWSTDVVEEWLSAGGDEAAETINRVLQQEGVAGLNEVMTKDRALGAQALSTLVADVSGG